MTSIDQNYRLRVWNRNEADPAPKCRVHGQPCLATSAFARGLMGQDGAKQAGI